MSTPPEVAVVRRFYGAYARRDLDTARACFRPDAVWRLPGRSPIAGAHRGWDAIHDDFLSKLGPLSGGTFSAVLTDVVAGENHVIAVVHATAEHRGRRLDITGCQLIEVEDGRIAGVSGHYSDQYAFDAFWS